MKQPLEIKLSTTQAIEVKYLKDLLTGGFVNTATVLASVENQNGNTVNGQSWPALLGSVSDIPGGYRGILNAGLNLEEGERYDVFINISIPGGAKAKVRRPVIAQHYEM